MQRIGVCCPDHHPTHARTHNRVSARRGAADRGARLKSDIERGRTKRATRRRGQAFDFRVRQAAGPVIAAGNDTLAQDKNCSNRWIRTGASDPPMCFGQCRPHESLVRGICHCGTLSKRAVSGNGFRSFHHQQFEGKFESYILAHVVTHDCSHLRAVLTRITSMSAQSQIFLSTTTPVNCIRYRPHSIAWHVTSLTF